MSGAGYDLRPPRGPKDKMRRAVATGSGYGPAPLWPPEHQPQGSDVRREHRITKEQSE